MLMIGLSASHPHLECCWEKSCRLGAGGGGGGGGVLGSMEPVKVKIWLSLATQCWQGLALLMRPASLWKKAKVWPCRISTQGKGSPGRPFKETRPTQVTKHGT